MLGVGVVESLLYGCAVALVVAGFKVFFDRKLHLLGTSLAYAGTFICCWLSRFGVPFMGRFPRRFCIESDYSMLLITSVVLLALHFAISYLRKRYGAKNS